MDTNLHIRISKELKENFQQLAKENNKDTSTLVRDWITNYVAEHQKANDKLVADLYLAGYTLQQSMGGREEVSKEFVKNLQEYSLTNQKEFTQLLLSTYMDLELTVPSIVTYTSKGFAYSQMFLLGLIGEKPKEIL